MSVSEAEYRQLLRKRPIGADPGPPSRLRRGAGSQPSKYKAVKTTVDGITFDSQREAAYYGELKLRLKAGEIRNLIIQPRFPLVVKVGDANVFEIIGDFVGDFQYQERVGGSGTDTYGDLWRLCVDDVKGMETLALARWKHKHVRVQYGITVREIR